MESEHATPTEPHEKQGSHSTSPSVQHHEITHHLDAADLPRGYFRSSFFIGTLIASGLSVSAGVGGFALAAPILSVINADIGPDPNLVWVGLGYTLTLAIGQALVGRLSDLFGRRWFFILGSAMALIGCVICAVAQNIPTVIGGTVLIGFAAASQLSYTFVLGELVPFKYRFASLAFVYLWAVPFSGLGPAMSYAFILHTSAGWRCCYYLMIAINAAATLSWFFFYHPPTFEMIYEHQKTKMQVIKNFDFIGLFLFVGGLLVFLMGLSWGGSVYPWKSANVIATIVIGFVALIVFVLYECYVPLEEPLVPMHLFRNGPWVADILLVALGASIYYAFAIVYPQMVFGLYTTDSMTGGWLSCVTGSAINAGQIISGIVAKSIGKTKYQLIIMSTLACAFLGSVACATPYNRGTVLTLLFLGCFSIGWVESVGLAISGIAIKDQAEIGTAVGVAGSIRSAVSTIAATVYVVILTNRLETTIPAQVPPALIAAGLPATSIADFFKAVTAGTPAAFAAVKGLTSEILAIGLAAYKVASASAYQTVFLSTIAFSGVAMILALFAPNVDDKMTDEVISTLHHKKDEKITSV